MMAIILANRIQNYYNHTTQRFVIDDVPKDWKDATLAVLASRGYNGYGLPLGGN